MLRWISLEPPQIVTLRKLKYSGPAAAAKSGALGADGAGLAKIRVTLHETDLARASYEGAFA